MEEQAPDFDAKGAPDQGRDSSGQEKSAYIHEVARRDKTSQKVSVLAFSSAQ